MSLAISIERVTKQDAEALTSLHAPCFSMASFSSLLENENTLTFVASRNVIPRKFQAFIVARVASDEVEILTLGTAPELRGLGLAHALVRAGSAAASAAGAKEIVLEVAVKNDAARALYSGIGFLATGNRAGYYRSNNEGIDSLILRALLPLMH